MTSKERVIAAASHQQPDRVPIDLSFAPEVQAGLRERLGVSDEQLWRWAGQDFAPVAPRFIDPASPKRYASPTVEVTEEGYLVDIFGVPFREVRTEFQVYVELVGRPPLAECESFDELDRHPWPTAELWDYSDIPAQLSAHADEATWEHSRGFFEIAHFMRGMDNFLTDLALRPDFAAALMDHIAEYLLAKAGRMLEAGGGRYVVFEYNDDVASQRGLFISPQMWRRLIKPRMARFCDLIHRHGALVRYHSCGSVRAIVPDLIEIGVDILNPVQSLAAGMDPFELKRAYGDRLTLHGGVDIQELLPRSTPRQVRQAVRRLVDVVGEHGGYILGGTHTIQADAPVENVVAMIDEALGRRG